VGWEFVASGSGLLPLALVSGVEPSDSTIVRVYSFLLDNFFIGGDGWARTGSSPPLAIVAVINTQQMLGMTLTVATSFKNKNKICHNVYSNYLRTRSKGQKSSISSII
jgi:hypothetical protein